MSEDRFVDWLQRESQDYNQPAAETPRDEMWSAIRSAPVPAQSPRRVTRTPLWIGMAATLLVGIGIGRFVFDKSSDIPAASTVVSADDAGAGYAKALPTVVGEPSVQAVPVGQGGQSTANSRVAQGLSAQGANTRGANTQGANTRGALSQGVAAQSVGTQGEAAGGAAPSSPSDFSQYDFASRAHLDRAEALISVVATAPRNEAIDSLTGTWARDMLSNTRLLIDSPAGDDPLRRQLLEDLETLLVQLVQRSGTPVEERAMIDRTLERTQLLHRLRFGAAGI